MGHRYTRMQIRSVRRLFGPASRIEPRKDPESGRSKHPFVRGLAPVLAFSCLMLSSLSRPLLAVGTYDGARFEFDRSSVQITSAGEDFHQIRCEGARFEHGQSRAGRPELPIALKWFILPDHTKIESFEVTVAEWDTIPGRYVPQPVPENEEVGTREPDPEHYERDTYPGSAAFIGKDIYYRGFHLAQVLVYPVQFLPRERRLRVASRMDVSISLRSTTREEESKILRIQRPEAIDSPTGSTRAYLAAMVVNTDQFDDFYPRSRPIDRQEDTASRGSDPEVCLQSVSSWPSTEGRGPRRVIITSDQTLAGEEIGSITAAAEDYANWSLASVPTCVITLQEISNEPLYAAADLEDSIQRFVRHSIERWGTEFFVLAGDLDVIPTRRLGAPDLGDHPRLDPLADIYYVMDDGLEWNDNGDGWIWSNDNDSGGWGTPQASIGRLPIRNEDDAEAIFSKLIDYQTGGETDYYEKVLLAAGPLLSANPNEDWCGYKIANEIQYIFSDSWPTADLMTRLYAVPPVHLEDCGSNPGQQCYKSLRDDISKGSPLVDAWEGHDLPDLLNDGYHFVWHSERGSWDRLGRASSRNTSGVTWLPADLPCDVPDRAIWQQACADHFEDWARTHWDAIEPLTSRLAIDLQNEGRYSIVLSPGAFTSAMDRESIGKALLQNPFGGAVAYIGKQQNPYLTEFVNIAKDLLWSLFSTANDDPRIGTALTMGILGVFGAGTEDANRWGYLVPLLGDPGMKVWPGRPHLLHLTLPSPIASLGSQTIAVTVRESDSGGDPVPNAVVTLLQDGLSYATAVSNASGVASFKGFAVLDTTDILVTASSRLGIPQQDTLQVSSSAAGHLVYDSHELYEPAPDADGDAIIETGELVTLHVVWRNNGTTTATAPNLQLWPTPSVTLDLDINGEFRPADTFVGGQNAMPITDASDVFRIPLTWEGLTVFGQPNPTLSNEAFKVWAEDATGRYVVAANSASASADTVFTGVLKSAGGFSNVSMTGEIGVDSFHVGGDSVWFSFKGDATEDRLYFYAKAADWVTVTPPGPTFYPNVAAGDTLGADFVLSFTEDVPDRTILPLTATAKHNGTLYAHSEFEIEIRGPDVGLLVIEWEPGGTMGSDTTVVLRPTLRNSGSAAADSLVVTCRIMSGSASVPDSTSELSSLESGGIVVPVDSIVIAAADSTALANLTYELELATLMKQAQRYLNVIAAPGSGGGQPDEASPPENLVATPEGRAIQLRWDRPTGSVRGGPIDRYLVYLRNESMGADSLDFLGETDFSAFEVFQIEGERLEPLDEFGDPIDYRFAVRACSRHYCGDPSYLSEQRTWLPEFSGWPKRMLESVSTAPLVVAVNGREAVFVGSGRRIYAWWLDDGTPLDPAYCSPTQEYALFFEAEPLDPDPIFSEANAVFAEALVSAEVDGHVVIFGNIINDCLYALEVVWCDDGYTSFERWKRCFRAGKTAPTVTELDDQSGPVVVLPGRADTLYVVMADDGAGYIEDQSPDGAFAVNATHFNLRSVAILDGTAFEDPHRIVQAERGGRVVVWNTPARDGDVLATPKWSKQVESAHAGGRYSLSTPSTGDVDDDGEPEIIVTDHSHDGGDGTVFILDGDPAIPNNAIEAQASNAAWNFLAEDSGHPAKRPSLACLEGSGKLQIVISGAQLQSGSLEATTYRSHVFAVDNGIDEDALCTVGALPYRFGDTGQPAAGSEEPIVADLDGDGSFEILMTTIHGDLAAWEYVDPDDCPAVLGWPIHFGDEALTPTLTEDGVLVASRDGYLHYYQYPDGGQLDLSGWPQYGYDGKNTGMHPDCSGALAPPSIIRGAERTLQAGPIPSRGSQQVLFRVSREGADVELLVFDVQGRRVRTLQSGPMNRGIHELQWPGTDDAGRRLPAGLYFYQLRVEGEPTQRLRTLLIR